MITHSAGDSVLVPTVSTSTTGSQQTTSDVGSMGNVSIPFLGPVTSI